MSAAPSMPRPWRSEGPRVLDEQGYLVTFVCGQGTTAGEDDQHAALFAAAPEMAEALEEAEEALAWLIHARSNCGDPYAECPLQDADKPSDDVQKALASARAALAKARGEEVAP